MNAKLKIDITHGLVEVEGSEEFISKIYDDFKDRLSVGNRPIGTQVKTQIQPADHGSGEQAVKRKTPAGKNKTGGPPTFVKDLNLAAHGTHPSLKDFCAQFEARSAKDWNLLFAYYLTKHAELAMIGQDHLYTCYKVCGVKPPAAFSQSIFDTASKKGWLESKSLSDIRLTIVGENQVDHDFKRKS